MAFVIEDHPQRAEIERAIIANSSVRSISEWVTPKVSPAAIQRYRANLLAPAVRNSAKRVATQAIASAQRRGADISAVEIRDEQKRDALLKPFLERIERKYKRYDKLLSEAEEGRILLDKKGNAVLDAEGKPIYVAPSLRDIAALDSAETRAMQFHGDALGITGQAQSAAGVAVNIALVLPRPADEQRAGDIEDGPVIDVSPA